MKGKKGICLILCILLLTGLAPLRASAVSGECVDGVWASVALTGGANKLIFTADSEIEQQILSPNEQTPEQYILPEGVAYDAESNTLSLTDFNAPTANLALTMMGVDFKLRLSGASSLASITSDSMGRGGSVTICGDGTLELSGGDNAILVRAGGAPDFVRVEPQVRLTASAEGSVIRVYETSLSDGAIVVDTSDPQVTAFDGRRTLRDVTTSDGKTLDICTLGGGAERFGVEAVPLSDEAGERIVYNVYRLEGPDLGGLYTAGEPIEQNAEDVSAYEVVSTPHDWTLVETNGGAAARRVRFARFTISAMTLDDGGTLSVSQSSVARGGIVEVNAMPKEGYKLVALTVNGEKVSAPNGSYIIGGITADQIVTASFAAASPATLTVTAPESTAFTVPADGAEAFVSEPFTAVVRDGAGDPVGAFVYWSVSPETEGVSIGADGRVTVTNAAKHAVGEGRSLVVTARVEGTDISDQSTLITVALAERKAAEVRLSRDGEALGESDVIEIPAAGETERQQYAALVLDQYGQRREEAIVWSAGDWPAGVRRDGDTLTVSDNCADGSSLVVTAAASTDSAVSASVTVRFAAARNDPPVSEPGGGENPSGAEPGEGESEEKPTIVWPTPVYVQNAVYGITWDELVTLDGGSAVLGDEELVGIFSIDKDGAGRPSVADSFRIIFTYESADQDNNTVMKTVTSEEYHVTLARKKLDPQHLRITLSPDTMQYDYGAECRPAVSLVDADLNWNLTPGTDFFVTGYSNNTGIGTANVRVEGLGNYRDAITVEFRITAIPASALTVSVTSCRPEDEGTKPGIVFKHLDGHGQEHLLFEGTDYDLSLQYDIPSKTGTAFAAFKGHYSGTRTLTFDLPNYLITEGAGSSWSKSSSTALIFRANGALGKFTELTVDGRTVPTGYYSTASGSTVVWLKADYLKSLADGKHIIGIAYKDGKALAIFSITSTGYQGVATGDSSNAALWIILLAASLIAFGTLAFLLVRGGGKKKKKKTRIKQ